MPKTAKTFRGRFSVLFWPKQNNLQTVSKPFWNRFETGSFQFDSVVRTAYNRFLRVGRVLCDTLWTGERRHNLRSSSDAAIYKRVTYCIPTPNDVRANSRRSSAVGPYVQGGEKK